MKRFLSLFLFLLLACSLCVSSFAVDSQSGDNKWEDYMPKIITDPVNEVLSRQMPEFVADPTKPSEGSKPALSPVFVISADSRLEKAPGNDSVIIEKADKNLLADLGPNDIAIVVKEVTEDENGDPIVDFLLSDKVHYYSLNKAAALDPSVLQTLKDVIAKADAANRAIVSAFFITAEEGIAEKIGKQENGEVRYIAFTFTPETIGLTDADELFVFVNGSPMDLRKDPDGVYLFKLTELGLVTFEVPVR